MKRYLFCAVLFLTTYWGGAQVVVNKNQRELDEKMVVRVKQFSEFIERFNYEKDLLNREVGDEFKRKITRQDYIKLLINKKDPRLSGKSSQDAANYTKLIDEFTIDVTAKKYMLDLCSNRLFAKAISAVTLFGKEEKMALILQKKCNENLSSFWSLTSVISDALELNTVMNVENLPPTSNETNFIDLKRILNAKKLPGVTGEFSYENQSVFSYLVHRGDLKFEYVREVEYFIFDIPGWILKVKEYERDDYNSGWLIEDVIRADSHEKQNFMKKELAIRNPEILFVQTVPEKKLFVSLKSFCPPVLNKGKLNSPTAWAVGYYCMSIINARNKNTTAQSKPDAFSPYYLQVHVAGITEQTVCTQYIDINQALYFCKKNGVVRMDDFPKNCERKMDTLSYDSSVLFRIRDFDIINPSFARVSDVSKLIRLVLQKNKPVPAQIRTDESFYKVNLPMWIPAQKGAYVTVITIVGFDDNKFGGAFEVVGCEGPMWGDRGYTWIKYDDFNRVVMDSYEIQD